MTLGFWSKLKRPIMALAPMANVTDAAFRRQFVEANEPAFARGELRRGKPDVFWTEFVSVEGLLSRGKEKLLVDLWYSKDEHPIVAQIFGGKPEQFEQVAPMIRELGFDGIDINMGCPDSGVEKSGGGASLIKRPEVAKEIICATKRGAGDIPVSVKTRIGYNKEEIDAWISALLEENPAALTVHLRTRKEMSDVPAHWELARRITELRDKISPETILLGNGDVDSLAMADQRIQESGFDGMMIGRGAFGNPWFFSGYVPTLRERLERLATHAELFEKLYRTNEAREYHIKGFEVMKKHFKSYCSNFDDAKELRVKLMETENAAQVKSLIEEFLKEQR